MLSESQLAALVRAMDHRSAPLQSIDAGYTYFGQFVAHELVSDSHPGGRVTTARLELDSLYGSEETAASWLNEAGRFEIHPNLRDGPDDLPRLEGIARIPDRRNDDTVILAQLHVFWQHVHNYVVDNELAHDSQDARRLVALAFQLLLVEDYLRLVLDPRVFDAYFRSPGRWLGQSPSAVPKEFALAAFRFGHSMVRPFYESSPATPSDIPLGELFRAGQPLDQRFKIDWRNFFGWPVPHNAVQDAMAIGPNVTAAMTKVPVRHRGVTVNIIEANLRAGEAAALTPGHALAQQDSRWQQRPANSPEVPTPSPGEAQRRIPVATARAQRRHHRKPAAVAVHSARSRRHERRTATRNARQPAVRGDPVKRDRDCPALHLSVRPARVDGSGAFSHGRIRTTHSVGASPGGHRSAALHASSRGVDRCQVALNRVKENVMSNSDQTGHLLSRRQLASFGLGLAATLALEDARAAAT